MPRPALASALALALTTHAYAIDDGRYSGADPKIRQWFESVRSPDGKFCCSISDGHRTTWRADPKTGAYEVPIDGEWISIPPEAVITGIENPVGEAVVWYVRNRPWGTGKLGIIVTCFVPGGAG